MGKFVKNFSRIFILTVLLIVTTSFFEACNGTDIVNGDIRYKDIESINVDDYITGKDFEGFSSETFDISQINLYVKYKNTQNEQGESVAGETVIIQATWDMVKAEDKARIKEIGTKNITLIYGQFEISFPLKIYDSVKEKYLVIFYAEDGETQLGDIQRVGEGGRAKQPTVPAKVGYTFVGWVDLETGESLTFDNIRRNLRLRASYILDNYSVQYCYINDEKKEVLIAEKVMAYNEIGEDHYPTVPELYGKKFVGWEKISNNKFYANYEEVQYNINLVYRKYFDGKVVNGEYDYSGRYSDSLVTVQVPHYRNDTLVKEPVDYLPNTIYSNGISDAGDYKFMYWYFKRGNDRIKVELPITLDEVYETTFYAYYVDMNLGSEDLHYKKTSSNECMISSYDGEDDVVVIPKKTIIDGIVYDVTGITDGVFKSSVVTEFVVKQDNDYFFVNDGVLYSKNKKVLYAYPVKSTRERYVLLDETETISSYAFYNAEFLTTVIFNDGLKHINDFAFRNCVSLVDVEFGEDLVDIGEGAFKMDKSSAITTLSFTGTEIISFGDEAFFGLNSLIEIEIPLSLSYIGDGVFYGCSSLEKIDAEKNSNFTSYNGALYDKSYKTLYAYPARYSGNFNPEIYVNPNCELIKRGAFYYSNISCVTIQSSAILETYSIVCPALTRLRIDDIGFNFTKEMFLQAFSEYVPKEIYVREGTNSFVNAEIEDAEIIYYDNVEKIPDYYDGYVYSLFNGEVTIEAYNGDDESLIIPSVIFDLPVTKIGLNAFNGNDILMSVELPIGIKEIGTNAFRNCRNLLSVKINSGYQNFVMGDMAFYGCNNLTNIDINSDILFSDFGVYVFEGTPILERESDFIIIGGVLLSYKGSSNSVVIPSNITYIATDAFKDLGFITSIIFAEGSRLTTVDEFAFFNCIGLSSISFPPSIKKVNDNVFYGCSFLYCVNYETFEKNIVISDYAYYQAGGHYESSVKVTFTDTIKKEIYYSVRDELIESVHNGNIIVKPITPEITPSEIFIGWYYDEELTERVTFPLCVDSLDETLYLYASIGYSSYVSDGIKYEKNEDGSFTVIGYDGTDYKLVIGDKYLNGDVVRIGDNAFSGEIYDIQIPHEVNSETSQYISKILSIGSNVFTETRWYKETAGDFVIYDNLFFGYKGDSHKVIIPDDITVLADGVFENNVTLEYVYIPDGVKVIPKNAFRNCTSLKQVRLGTSLLQIEENAFSGCTSLIDINFEDTVVSSIDCSALDNTAWLNERKNDCVIINGILYKYYGHENELHIPSSISVIEEEAFLGNKELSTIHLPSSLTGIRQSAFKNCISLNAVYVPANESQLLSISESSFENCINLGIFDFSVATNLQEIGNKAFAFCTGIRDFVITQNLISIGDYAFRNSGVVTISAVDDARLQAISIGAFQACRSLKNINLGEMTTLREIGNYAFYECSVLERLTAHNIQLTTIGDYAFYNCKNFTIFDTNERSIVTIGRDAVYGVNYITAQNTNMVFLGNILVSYSGTEKIINIPANVTLIYNSAFEGNTNIVQVSFTGNSALRTINDRAFYGCSSLESINFPLTLDTIGYQVMDGTVWYENQLETVEYITINNILIKYNINYTRQAEIPLYVNKIIRGAFYGSSVYDIRIGANVTWIENGAFDGIGRAKWTEGDNDFDGWTMTLDATKPFANDYRYIPENCLAVYLPDELALTEFNLDEDWVYQRDIMKVIDRYVINYSIVNGEARTILPETVHALYNAKDVSAFRSTAKQFVFVGWYLDKDYQNPVVYPFILTDNTTIYAKCIDYDKGSNPESYILESVDEREGYYTITSYENDMDKYLIVITEQANKKVYSISGFLGYIPYAGNEYEKFVFNEEDNIFEEYDPYGNYADDTIIYRRNTNIEELNFANNCTIEVLGDNCFAGMVNLTKITLPASIKYISANAFADCVNLREIIISDGVRNLTIAEGAFRNCVSLQSIVIPKGVTGLENEAFVGCVNLKEIHLRGETPIVLYANAKPFEKIVNMKIYIPLGKIPSYSAIWGEYYEYLVEEIDEHQ